MILDAIRLFFKPFTDAYALWQHKRASSIASIGIEGNTLSGVYAERDEVITCERGHTIARFKRTVMRGELQDEEAMDFPGPTLRPEPGTRWPEICCAICGSHWFRGNGHFHFKDGWR